MSVYRNGDVIKFGLKQFCNFFNCDVKVEYKKDEWGDEYFYKALPRDKSDFHYERGIPFKSITDVVDVFSDLFENEVESVLWFSGLEDVFYVNEEESFYKQAKDWIDCSRPDLQDTDIYGVLCAIIDRKVLRDDLGKSAVFIRRASMAYAKVSDTCYSVEQAFYLANKRWSETKDKNYWEYFYIQYGDEILKDFKKESIPVAV